MLLTILVIVVASAALVAGAAWGAYGKLPSELEGFIVALAGGALIAGIHPQSWLRPDASVAEWLRFLVGQGYELADIEQHIVDAVPAKAAPTDDEAANVDEWQPETRSHRG